MKILSFLGLITIACCLASCGVRGTIPTGTSHQLQPGEGYVVATFSSKGINRSGKEVTPLGMAFVNANGINENEKVKLALSPQFITTEKTSTFPLFPPLRQGETIAIPVPAGNYEIIGWRVNDQAPTAAVTFMNRLPMKVPFQVRAGESTYVGRINALSIYGKNLFGMQVPGEAIVIISDQYSSDARKISQAYPSIKQSSIRDKNVSKAYKAEMMRIANTPPKYFGLF